MIHDRATARKAMQRAMLILAVIGASSVGSYGLIRAWRRESARVPSWPTTREGTDTSHVMPFASGKYLVAFVLVASECGYSTEKKTEKAIRELRDSLRASHGRGFAQIWVHGVVMDGDLGTGVRYVRRLDQSGTAFDQLSMGGTWLNEQVIRFVWRERWAKPEIPQVVLVERRVDARSYPKNIDIAQDSVVLIVSGRTDIITWVKMGTPLDFRPSRYIPRRETSPGTS